jgi:hypothetical protein
MNTAKRNCLIAAIAQENGLTLRPESLELVCFPRARGPFFRKAVLTWLGADRPKRVQRSRPRRERPPTRRDEGVYLVRALHWIKIGVAKNVQKRLRDLQIACPMKLQLLAVVPGCREVEKSLHQRFETLHEHGEWFRAEEPLLSFVTEMVRRHGSPQ